MSQRVNLSACSDTLNLVAKTHKTRWRNAEREILDLMSASFDDLDLPTSSTDRTPAQLAADFKLIAANKRPLSSKRCNGIAESYLNQKLRVRHSRWLKDKGIPILSPISHLRKKRLKAEDHQLIKTCATELHLFFDKKARKRGARMKIAQRTALIGLANIYARAIKSNESIYNLPHGDRSHFIEFCRAALEPFVAKTECTSHALARAWKTIKVAEKVLGKPS